VFIWGPPGVGKSQMVRDISEELDEEYRLTHPDGGEYGFIDVRLLQLDPVDLRGLPYLEKVVLEVSGKDGLGKRFSKLEVEPPSLLFEGEWTDEEKLEAVKKSGLGIVDLWHGKKQTSFGEVEIQIPTKLIFRNTKKPPYPDVGFFGGHEIYVQEYRDYHIECNTDNRWSFGDEITKAMVGQYNKDTFAMLGEDPESKEALAGMVSSEQARHKERISQRAKPTEKEPSRVTRWHNLPLVKATDNIAIGSHMVGQDTEVDRYRVEAGPDKRGRYMLAHALSPTKYFFTPPDKKIKIEKEPELGEGKDPSWRDKLLEWKKSNLENS